MNGFKAQEVCVKIATLWGYGLYVVILAALPIIGLLHLIMLFSAKVALWSFCVIAVAMAIVSSVAFRSGLVAGASSLVLDKTLGMVIAFLFVPIWVRIKLFVFGLLMFYFFLFLQRYVLLEEYYPTLKACPPVMRMFVDDCAAGIVVNFFLQLVIWTTR